MKFWRSILTLATCLLLVGGSVLAPVAPAAAERGLRDQIPRQIQDVDPKIDSRLEAEIAARPDGHIPVIIMLEEQPVPFEVEAAKSLQAETQVPLMTELTMIGAENITEHWIVNAISATVYAPKIAEIAARPDVEKVWLDEEISLPEPPELPELYPEPAVDDDAIRRLKIPPRVEFEYDDRLIFDLDQMLIIRGGEIIRLEAATVTPAEEAVIIAPHVKDAERVRPDKEFRLPAPPEVPDLYPEPPVDDDAGEVEVLPRPDIEYDVDDRVIVRRDETPVTHRAETVRQQGANVTPADEVGIISGRVTDTAEKPVVDARIVVWNGVTAWTTTAEDGTYEIPDLPAGTYTMRVFPPRGAYLTAARIPDIEVTAGATTTVDVTLPEGGIIAGRVTDSEGHGLYRAWVIAWDPILPIGWIIRTNVQGYYTTPGLSPGETEWIFFAPPGVHLAPVEIPITVTAGETTTVDVALTEPGGVIAGRVTDPDGLPVADALVEVREPVLGGGAWVFTDKDGYYTTHGLSPGITEMWVRPPHDLGLPSAHIPGIEVVAGETTIVNVTLGVGIISGRVTDTAGAPVADALVAVWCWEAWRWIAVTRTDAEGYYITPPVPAGEYLLDVIPPVGVHLAPASIPVEVTAGVTVTVDVTLPEGGIITGRVTDPAGVGVADAVVWVFDAGILTWLGVTTDAEGYYTTTGLTPGITTMEVVPPPGYLLPALLEVEVVTGETTTVNVALEKGGVIAGTVTDTAGEPVPGAAVLGRKQLMGLGWGLLAFTAADGSFATPVLAPDTYEIIVSPAWTVPLTPAWVPDIAVIVGETSTQDVTLYWDYGDPIVNAPPMWDAGYDGEGIKIAILDTGIDYTHPDLADRIIAAKDFTGDGTVMDWHGHGTHVAGIAAGAYNQEWQISGVAPGAYLLNARIFNVETRTRTSWILRAIEWSMDQGAHILNMSFGAHQWDGTGRMPICRASANAVAAGHIVVPAAGNEAPGQATILRPAIAHDVIAVAASEARDEIVWFSSRGPAGDGRVALDVAAPGLWVIAPVPPHIVDPWGRPPEFGLYDDWSGTSMSAPHVAGAAALLLDAFPGLTPAEVEMALKSSADDLAAGVLDQGAGRLNVHAAYLALREGILVEPHEWSVGRVLPGAFTQTFTVINNGTAPITLPITRSIMTDTQGAVAGDWITVPASITVEAGATATFDAAMTIPPRARAGTYSGYITVGDTTIPVSVGIVQYLPSMWVMNIIGTVDEGANLFGWGDHVYYTLDVQPGIANLNLSLDWTDEWNDLDLMLFNPLGEVAAASVTLDHPEVVSVDSPMPGEWMVLIMAWGVEPRTEERYTLRVETIAAAGGEITLFTVTPEEVVRHDEATFDVEFSNHGGAAVDVGGEILIYYLGEHGRGFPVIELLLEEVSVEAGQVHTWTITELLTLIPGSYEATARLFYGDEIVTEKVISFTILPSGTGTFTGVVSSATTGEAIAGATVEAIDPVTDEVIATATTDADGTYELVVDEGTYEFRVSADGFIELYQELDVIVDAGAVVILDFELWGRVTVYPAPPALTNVSEHTITGTMEKGAIVTLAADTAATFGPVTYPTPTTWTADVTLVEGTNIITATATIGD
ncbi:carboxypeptidase regulatory-like domain-containing protein, partial [Dehalococcoidia bacterium]|nr:carboxypeptidase regulatory-like domain-containing protein [Dehalococcoidia bacterium]